MSTLYLFPKLRISSMSSFFPLPRRQFFNDEHCYGGITSSFVRKPEKIIDMPLNSDVFKVLHGYNAPQQVHIIQGDHEGRAIIVSWVTPDEAGSSTVSSSEKADRLRKKIIRYQDPIHGSGEGLDRRYVDSESFCKWSEQITAQQHLIADALTSIKAQSVVAPAPEVPNVIDVQEEHATSAIQGRLELSREDPILMPEHNVITIQSKRISYDLSSEKAVLRPLKDVWT
ncbi:hypothetical protein Scep_003809 [Stephania cephalantha]|uniref:Uncharacterized protein n=1 Tax=Stephania cephalantha TaxID=152367 RepID=A0AAP0KS50_9MAGN